MYKCSCTNKTVELIKSDLFRYTGDLSFRSFISTYIREPGFSFIVWLRIRTSIKSKLVGLILHRKKIKLGMDIQTFNIGKGFYIGHWGQIFVSSEAVIGNNCNISQGVTIGVSNRGNNKGAPTIGDRVYIGPGVKIFGNIKIGNDVSIGANDVVTKDIPDNSVAVGIPARVISSDGSQGYIGNIFNKAMSSELKRKAGFDE